MKLKVYVNKTNQQKTIVLPKKIFGELKEVTFLKKDKVIKFK